MVKTHGFPGLRFSQQNQSIDAIKLLRIGFVGKIPGELTFCELEHHHIYWENPLFRLGHFENSNVLLGTCRKDTFVTDPVGVSTARIPYIDHITQRVGLRLFR